MLTLENPKAIGESFNIGNARAVTTIYGLAQTVCRVLNSKSKITFREPLSADIVLRIPETKKSLEILGFKAEVDLDDGILRDGEVVRGDAAGLAGGAVRVPRSSRWAGPPSCRASARIQLGR